MKRIWWGALALAILEALPALAAQHDMEHMGMMHGTANAKLQVSPATVSFGNTALKQTAAQKITLSNSGNSKIAITRVILGGAAGMGLGSG